MSDNKMKYWTVTTSRIVRANTKADALAAVQRKPANGAKVLNSMSSVDRISAAEANELTSV